MPFWKRWFGKNHDANPTHAHAHAPGPTQADIKRAYERGRRDERARHKSHPILSLVVFTIALVGAGMIYLAAREGSFTRGGYVVDTKLASAADQAQTMGQEAGTAVSDAGQSLQGAGQDALNR